ncbi:hypothetical protein PFISCL1PPCAC_13927, partial [Pristionchus fissidentatus]
ISMLLDDLRAEVDLSAQRADQILQRHHVRLLRRVSATVDDHNVHADEHHVRRQIGYYGRLSCQVRAAGVQHLLLRREGWCSHHHLLLLYRLHNHAHRLLLLLHRSHVLQVAIAHLSGGWMHDWLLLLHLLLLHHLRLRRRHELRRSHVRRQSLLLRRAGRHRGRAGRTAAAGLLLLQLLRGAVQRRRRRRRARREAGVGREGRLLRRAGRLLLRLRHLRRLRVHWLLLAGCDHHGLPLRRLHVRPHRHLTRLHW